MCFSGLRNGSASAITSGRPTSVVHNATQPRGLLGRQLGARRHGRRVSTFNGQDNQNTRWIAQTDFERPWGEEGKLEAGWKSTWNEDVSDFDYTEADSTVLTDGIFLPYGLDTVDYAFLYDEQVHAAYVTAGQTLASSAPNSACALNKPSPKPASTAAEAKPRLSPTTTSASTLRPTSLWRPTEKTPSA